jgi:hypothetical protein
LLLIIFQKILPLGHVWTDLLEEVEVFHRWCITTGVRGILPKNQSFQIWVIPENIYTTPMEEHPTPFGCPNAFSIITNNFFFSAEISSVGGVWIFSGMTQYIM